MDQEIERLTAAFNRSSTIAWKRDSIYDLRYDGNMRMVIAYQNISEGSCIGFLEGLPKYVWDMVHGEYVFVQHDLVLDVSHLSPRPLLTLMRSEDESEYHSNCIVVVEHDHYTHVTRFPVYATRAIFQGDELVYRLEDR